ncbi:MAG TPA: alpha/beta hydrolase [Candidatus Dormibacteraeota bacterium]|nr:alpha/beta hydrolase [Candidatus Dormibacteraeota bacterium]
MTSRVAHVLLLVAFLLTACTRNPASSSHSPNAIPTPSPGHLAWTACAKGFDCATLQVPLDYAHPDAGTIGIALNRKVATDASHRIGSVLVNPGGPGDSGITFLEQSVDQFSNINRVFDLIGFDPRGVGKSSAITCLSQSEEDQFLAEDGVLDDPQERQAQIDADKAFAAGCKERSGRVLPFVDTFSAARDMDLIRAAVGDAKITYLGFSYGTELGQAYAHLFPTHIRALVLDGVVDPSLSANDELLAYVTGFESNLQAFLSNCRAHRTVAPKCQYAQSGDPGTKLTNLSNRLDKTPLPVGQRQLTRSLAVEGVQTALFDQASWPYLDQALTLTDSGNGTLLLEFADLLNSEVSIDSNLAVSCLDKPVPTDVAAYDALGPAFAKASPFFGPSFQYSNLVCAYWPARPVGTAQPLHADGAPPILLVGGTNDPATPYAWSQSVNQQLAGSVLLTRTGNGHTSYGSSVCSQQYEDAYLIQLSLPPAGTTCNS